MPFHIAWYIPQRLIYVRLAGHITPADMTAGSARLVDCLDEGTPLVHLVVDDRDLESTPTSLAQVRNALQFLRHRSLGWVIATGSASPMFRFVTDMLARALRLRARRYATVAEALAFLQAQDATLDWEQARPAVLPGAESAS
ncbi:MAG: hypothetical protein MUE40_12805 [Anaerolineae bacterium]|jgi:hypothetical protein|nr:hypothetical protein [Anaerolineae bacterium]